MSHVGGCGCCLRGLLLLLMVSPGLPVLKTTMTFDSIMKSALARHDVFVSKRLVASAFVFETFLRRV
jgi:hypothetical protein